MLKKIWKEKLQIPVTKQVSEGMHDFLEAATDKWVEVSGKIAQEWATLAVMLAAC